MSIDERVSDPPSLISCGEAGIFFFTREPTWITRHTETIDIESENTGRRRLTVDVTLPQVDAAVVPSDDGQATYCLPIALLKKSPPTSHIDFRDEEGRALSLLTRDESAEVSFVALRKALEAHGAGRLYPEFDEDADALLFGDEVYATVKAVVIAEQGLDADHVGRDRLERVLFDLAANSYIWVLLRGRPGERRVLKFSYAYTRVPAEAVIHDEREGEAEFTDGVNVVTLPVVVEGRIRIRRTARRWLRAVATSVGWAAYQVDVDFPAFRGTHSYHMQIQAPEGLVLKGVSCDIDPGDGEIESSCDGLRGHLYLWGADVSEGRPITIALRADRRGFLNLSFAATIVAATGLWVAQACAEKVDTATERQIAAAVLLVLPALLAFLVVRQTEHPLVTRLLAGVRALVMLAGFSSVAAAAALAGIGLEAWQDLSEAWIWCASAATTAVAGVGLAWLLSWPAVSGVLRRAALTNVETFLARLVVLGLLVFAWFVAARFDVAGLAGAEPLIVFVALILASAALTAAATPADYPPLALRLSCGLVTLAAAEGIVTTLLHDVRLR